MKDQYVIIDLRDMDYMKDKDGKIEYYFRSKKENKQKKSWNYII